MFTTKHLALAGLLTVAAGVQAKQDTRPNILFIFTDDWGWGDLSCHGHPYVKTPNIDRLAAEGTDFTKFTVASGVCSPSRAAVMTGQFPARHSIDGHFAWVHSNEKRGMSDWLNPKSVTMQRLLQQSGYATAHYGKWHISNNMIPDSPSLLEYGYDEYGAFNCSGEQMPYHQDSTRAKAFIEKSVKAGKPFFINLWMHEPHTPHHTVPMYQRRFPNLSDEDNIYASILSHADDRIGELLDSLDELQIAENTLVVFSSDNGPARAKGTVELKTYNDSATGIGYNIAASKGITAGRRGCKASLFEGGINVPFIARWPKKIESGALNTTSMISAVDLLPTFCEIAGVELPADYKADGISQTDALFGKNIVAGREKPLFWKYPSRWPADPKAPDHWVSYAVVHKNWKLVANNDLGFVKLYDITKDIYEEDDLKEARPEVAAELKKMITDWQATLPTEADPSCFSKYRSREPLNKKAMFYIDED